MELFSVLNSITMVVCFIALVLAFKKAKTKKDHQIRWVVSSMVCVLEFWMGLGTEQGDNVNILLGFVWLGFSFMWHVGIRKLNIEEEEKNEKYIETFHKNLNDGIEYYRDLFNQKAEEFQGKKAQLIQSLDHFKEELNDVKLKVMGVLH